MGNILKRYNGTNWETVSGAITGDTLPIGAIVAYSSNNAPTNWLICDGSAINRVTYAELFSVIGTTYGSGDGTTTFNLPNAKGRTIVGLDSSQTEFNAMGKTGGSKYLQEHDHTIGTSMSQFANFTVVSGGDGGTPYFNENNKSGIAGTGDSGNLQPYLTENVIIKAFQSSGVVANVAQVKTTSDTDTYSCNYINDNLQLKGKILWTNPNPTTSFAGQTVTLSETIDNYDSYEVIYIGDGYLNKAYMTTGRIPKRVSQLTYNYFFNARREITSISGTSIVFGNGNYFATYGSDVVSTSNIISIPWIIIGYKTGLFN